MKFQVLNKVMKDNLTPKLYKLWCKRVKSESGLSRFQSLNAKESVRDVLYASFTWEDTPERHQFWSDIAHGKNT